MHASAADEPTIDQRPLRFSLFLRSFAKGIGLQLGMIGEQILLENFYFVMDEILFREVRPLFENYHAETVSGQLFGENASGSARTDDDKIHFVGGSIFWRRQFSFGFFAGGWRSAPAGIILVVKTKGRLERVSRFTANQLPADAAAIAGIFGLGIDQESGDGVLADGLEKRGSAGRGSIAAATESVRIVLGLQKLILLRDRSDGKLCNAREHRRECLLEIATARRGRSVVPPGKMVMRPAINEVDSAGLGGSGRIVGRDDTRGDRSYLNGLLVGKKLEFWGSIGHRRRAGMGAGGQRGRPVCG